jgi:hypothetical protein
LNCATLLVSQVAFWYSHIVDPIFSEVIMSDSKNSEEETSAIITKYRSYVLPKSAGKPIEDVFPDMELPDDLKGSKIWQTPDGEVITPAREPEPPLSERQS